jgi:hypothetical protein
MIFSDLIQDLQPVSSRSPRSDKRKRTHMVEANDFRHFLSLGVEDPVSDTESLPTVLGVENLSRAGRLRKNSKCWQRRQPRLFHTYQSHVESYTVLLSTMSYYLINVTTAKLQVNHSESNCAVGWNSYMYRYAEWHNALPIWGKG